MDRRYSSGLIETTGMNVMDDPAFTGIEDAIESFSGFARVVLHGGSPDKFGPTWHYHAMEDQKTRLTPPPDTD